MNSAKKIPSPLVSLFPIAFLVGMLFATIHTFGSDALSGGSQISLLATTGMCVFIGMAFYRIPWKDYELAITNNISGVATAIIILLIIGALSGTWMISGVVPTLIYYGMQIIHPNFFPCFYLHYLCISISNDGKFMDHYRHHRYRPFGHRQGTRF